MLEFRGYHTRYESIEYTGSRYDLRHAMQGDREMEFVDNGMDMNKRETWELSA